MIKRLVLLLIYVLTLFKFDQDFSALCEGHF